MNEHFKTYQDLTMMATVIWKKGKKKKEREMKKKSKVLSGLQKISEKEGD